MIISGITYSRQLYKFKSPLLTSKGQLTERQILIVNIELEDGTIHQGEAAPLPAFGSETIEQAEESLINNIPALFDVNTPSSLRDLDILLNNLTSTPTIRTALEQCFINLMIKNNLTEDFPLSSEIRVNGLSSITDIDENLSVIKNLIKDGYKTIKIKIGIIDFSEELTIIQLIRRSFPNLALRLDVNGSWDYKTARENLLQLEELNIEYVEQPVIDTMDLIKISKEICIPLAADESIRSLEDATYIITESDIKYLVLKPMFIGGVLSTNKIIASAKNNSKEVIISSSLESNLGRNSLALAASFANPDIAHGLSTSNYFLDNKYMDSYPVINGQIKFSLEEYSGKPA